ncbi:gephyrin-like molybdotransferase Glp [Humibacter sp.]|jgi:molybdopterin molybdotransferase|uniref:molybdopterin molybdotransferase MoeA n=1 Tax=Humibacter sp. TaxID=1940291 RepID=UPI002CDB4DB3|nr:gephyrin-like molybdotransferase Glp [Humibacter sp.]HVX07566.1 gephyrin-like molybdotransferase Glp [Humibacter sp.]
MVPSEHAGDPSEDTSNLPPAESLTAEPLTVEQWQERVLASVGRTGDETVPLADAQARTVAVDVRTRHPVPLFDNSSMDGYAVRHSDVRGATPEHPVQLVVVADAPAGSGADPVLPAGAAVRVMTGAPVPSQADAVVPVEDTVEHHDAGRWVEPTDQVASVHVLAEPVPGRFIRRTGEDAESGTTVLHAGRVLTPAALASIAAAGWDAVRVSRRPRVVVVSTGSELVAPGTPPSRGMIPDSNTALLTALVQDAGGVVVDRALVSDDPARLLALLDALSPDQVDAVVLSGGVSAGAFDVVKAALTDHGSVTFARLAMQPGKPQGFGRLASGIPAYCLPGNPVSSLVSFELFVRPALAAMLRRSVTRREVLEATAGAGWSSPAGRRQYIPVSVEHDGGAPVVRPSAAGGSGSHLVASLAAAEALAVVAEGVTEVRPGDRVGMLPLA